MPKMFHVALLIETSRAYGRGILQGVIRYQREHAPWSIFFQPHGLNEPPPPWLKNWHGDGILARIDDRAMANTIRRTGLPAVDLRFAVPRLGLPGVGIDNQEVVRLAFEHLTNSGLKQFGFCGLPKKQSTWMDLRRDLFQKQVKASGYPCFVFEAAELAEPESSAWEDEQEQIAAWLVNLPKPIGIMACNDDRGQQVLDACRRVNVLVPDEVAVIGVDNDEILCNLSFPPLTSVNINTQQVGYEAADLLNRIMMGQSAPEEPLLLSPYGVVPRESTDVLATDDRELATALRLMRKQACKGLRIKDLVREVRLSRRELERRTRTLLGRSPKEEITRVQIEMAKQLLTTANLPVATIAEKCGYTEAKYFCQVFRQRVGLSPGAYRKSQKRVG
jgi:LacI family transcriptional regulator